MSDCKNCPYTDEYCASGDCNKIQAKDVACNKISLTEQWKKGELPAGYYYIEAITGEKIIDFMPYNEKEFKIFPSHTSIVICEVPSYEEWQLMQEDNKRLKHDVGNLGYKIKNQRHEIDNRLKEIEKLKDLLKECREEIASVEWDSVLNDLNQMKLLTKIDEVLK